MRPYLRTLLLAVAVGPAACANLGSEGGAPPGPGETTVAEPGERQRSPEAELMYHIMAGEMAGHGGKLEQALEHYARAMRLSDDPRIAERATRIAIYARNRAAATQAAQRWVDLAPEDLEARQVLAALYIRGGELERSTEHLEQVLAAHSATPDEGFPVITSLLSREQDKAAALKVMDILVDKHQDNPYAHYALAQLALHNGEPERAAEAVERAVERKPDWTKAHVLRAQILVRVGRTDEALEKLGREVERRPSDQELRLTYARLLVDARRLETARRQFEVLSEQAPEDPKILYSLGLLNLEAQRYEQAETYFRRLLETGNRVQEAFFYLGAAAQSRQAYGEAIEWYSKVTHGERELDAQIRIGALLAERGDIAAARDKFQSLREAHPEQRTRLYVAEAEVLREAGEYETGFALLTRALEENPGNADLLYSRALVAEKLDRLEQLEEDLRTVIAENPDNAHALNALGYTLADRTDRYQEALKLIQRAHELAPNDPAVIDSLGWVHYRLGNHRKAIKHLRRALELSGDPEIAAHLGEVLWVTGDQPAAEQVWQRALNDSPDSEILHNVIERFTE